MINFSSLHPAVLFLYFLSVMLVSMFTSNPIIGILSLIGAAAFVFVRKKGKVGFKAYILIFILISVTNPLFSHKGETTLFFFNGNPVTLEAFLYGVNTAVILIAVILWFSGFNSIMTEDKLLFLFGKAAPKITLLISSALRFIPLLKNQADKIRASSKAMGSYSSDKWLDKLKATAGVYSVLITWALENAIDTGASMKARGYGLKGRTHYSVYKFTKNDAFYLIMIAVLDTAVIIGLSLGELDFSFYPRLPDITPAVWGVAAFTAFALLALLPAIDALKEELGWKYYRSKI